MTSRLKNRTNIKLSVTKKIDRLILIGSIAGLILFVFGLWRFIIIEPTIGFNLRTKLPVIINGTYPIVLGIGILLGSFYSLKIRTKLINKEIERINKEKLKNRRKF